jgi:hypothetical protein
MMTKDQELWKNSWVKFADWIQGNDMSGTLLGTVKKPLAQMAVWLSNNSVNKMLRTLAFQHLIGLNIPLGSFIFSLNNGCLLLP